MLLYAASMRPGCKLPLRFSKAASRVQVAAFSVAPLLKPHFSTDDAAMAVSSSHMLKQRVDEVQRFASAAALVCSVTACQSLPECCMTEQCSSSAVASS